MMRTLLLDQNFMPIEIISWEKAVRYLFDSKARVVESHEEPIRCLRTIVLTVDGTEFHLTNKPSVIHLTTPYKRRGKHVRFSKINVFWRDDFQCQYCGDRFQPKMLTFDHVLPKSAGGPKTWENIVTACRPCNQRKSGRTPEQAKMKLLRKPERPRWSPQLTIRLKNTDPEVWHQYVYWQTPMDLLKA